MTSTPTINISASSSTICAGQTSTLTANGASNYAWLPGAQTTTFITVNPTSTSTYTVNGSNGTCYASQQITIYVSAPPSISSSLTNTTICSGTSVNVSVTGASSYTWLPSGSNSSSVLSPNATTNYTVTGSNGSCLGNTVTFTINVNQSPSISASATPSIMCSGESSTLTANGATNYTWTPSTSLSNNNTNTVVANPNTTTIYTVTGSNGTCASSNSITLTVNTCTGLQNINAGSGISIYPNPSKGVFNISSSSTFMNVTIINALGQIVLEESLKSNLSTIDLSKMSKGIYYLKASTNEGTKLFKLILE